MKLSLGSYRVFVVGAVMGLAAAAIQAFFKVQPPEAYGISMTGHPSDLFSWIVNHVLKTSWPIREEFLIYPCLTIVGIFVGSSIAASRNKELRFQPGPVRKKFAAVIFGFLVANFGLLLGSCDMRCSLLIAYGSVLGVIGLASIAVGIILAIIYIRSRARKGAIQ
jgi:hypothetical protein